MMKMQTVGVGEGDPSPRQLAACVIHSTPNDACPGLSCSVPACVVSQTDYTLLVASTFFLAYIMPAKAAQKYQFDEYMGATTSLRIQI